MSLNGLEAVKVKEAYDTIIAEAAGWFLLNYISRDEVDVLRSGIGSSSEVREAVAQYEEKSPLYGLVVYRRKKVLLKYVPEGTSRLLQARLAVHLQSVIERFSHDALLAFEKPAELSENNLSSSVSVLKTSGSTRSLDSTRKRRLTEITEDASETPLQTITPVEVVEVVRSSASTGNELDIGLGASAARPEVDEPASADISRPESAFEGNDSMPSSVPVPSAEDTNRRPSATASESSKTIGENTDLYWKESIAFAYKAKMKLGPRPSGSVITLPANTQYIQEQASITPEKQRLMKALQKRKQHQHEKQKAKEKVLASTGMPEAKETSNRTDTDIENPKEATPNGAKGLQNINGGLHNMEHESSAIHHAPENGGDNTIIVPNDNQKLEPSVSATARESDGKPQNSTPAPGHAAEELHEAVRNVEKKLPRIESDILFPDWSNSPQTARKPLSPIKDFRAALLEPELITLPPPDEEELRDLDESQNTESQETYKQQDPKVEAENAPQDGRHLNEILNNRATIKPAAAQTKEVVIERKPKPPPIIPIKPEDTSRAPSLSDDSLLEELQSATVEEAKSVSLSKTPSAPFSPASPRQIEMKRSGETSGKPTNIDSNSPRTPTIPTTLSSPISKLQSDSDIPKVENIRSPPRSFSSPAPPETPSPSILTALPTKVSPKISSQSPRLDSDRSSSKKSGMSSLISQRIKAFEKFSNSSSPPPAFTPQVVTLRKTSFNTPPPSAGGEASQGNLVKMQPPYPTPSPSPQSFAARKFRFGKSSPSEPVPKPSTSSSPAALVKDVPQAQALSEIKSPSSEATLSPVSAASKRTSFFGSKYPVSRKSKSNSISSTTSSIKDIPLSPRPESSSNRPSIGSRRSSMDTVGPTQSSSASINSEGGKKDSKKKRLFRRLSNIGSNSRRTIAQTLNLNDQPIMESQEPDARKNWSSPVSIGELNVQFPDTLFWKRRHLEIDAHGYLILAPSRTDRASKVGTKRYHVSEFYKPHIPEIDREELPHSVALDFKDSSTLQFACERSTSQMSVLQALVEAYEAFVGN